MPLLKGSASDFTSFVKAAAFLPGARSTGNSGTAPPTGVLSSVVTASAVARASVKKPTTTTTTSNAAATSVYLPASTVNIGSIIKYDIYGVVKWCTTTQSKSVSVATAVATDSTGVYVTGYYTSASVVTLNNGVTLPISAGTTPGQDAFIVKYDTSGLAQWATTIAATFGEVGYGIAVDSTGVYVTGSCSASVVNTANNGITFTKGPTFGSGAFTVKYDTTNGLAQWATLFSTANTGAVSGGDHGGIATDSTGVYITGIYSSASVVTLNNGKTLPISTNGASGQDVFIIKCDTNGVVQWATTIAGTGIDRGYNIATDSTGVYVTGFYTSASVVTLNNGKTLPISAGTTPGQDAFIVKYDTSGLAQWATTIAGTGSDQGYSIATDSTGVYLTGFYTSTSAVTLNNGKTLPASGLGLGFTVKYDRSGLAQWAVAAAGSGWSINTDSTGVYAVGAYSSASQVLLTNAS